jgi:hypothetical protein
MLSGLLWHRKNVLSKNLSAIFPFHRASHQRGMYQDIEPDFKKSLIANISLWQDTISDQASGIENIGMAPDGNVA